VASGVGCSARDELEEPRGPGVDHARLAEDVELLGRPRDDLLAARHEPRQQRIGRVGVFRLRSVGEPADRRQHRPFHRLPDRAVGRIARGAERPGDRGGVDGPALGERLGGAAHDLREDDAGVPARAHQSRAGRLARERLAVGGVGGLEGIDDRAGGQREVRSGVAVGNRVDVQVVDPAAALLDRRDGPAEEREQPLAVGHADCRTSWMRTSIEVTRRPVRRSTSYWT
jgi:hypothetical protein